MQQCVARRRSRILAYAHGSSPYTGKVSVWRCIINDWTRLDQVTMLSWGKNPIIQKKVNWWPIRPRTQWLEQSQWCDSMKGSDVQEAHEDLGRPDREAYIQQRSENRIQQKPRGREAFTEGPNEAIAEFRDVAWMATAQQCKRRRRWDTGGLTANNNHAGGVEDLRNHAVVKSQRPKEREGSDSRPRCCKVPRP